MNYLSVIAQLLGLGDLLAKWLHDAEERNVGAKAQQQADITTANKEAVDARVIEANDSALSDADLDRRLSGPGSHR